MSAEPAGLGVLLPWYVDPFSGMAKYTELVGLPVRDSHGGHTTDIKAQEFTRVQGKQCPSGDTTKGSYRRCMRRCGSRVWALPPWCRACAAGLQ